MADWLGVITQHLSPEAMMKYTIITVAVVYSLISAGVFAMHMQMPVTFWLAALRSAFWPIWVCGGLNGSPLPMD
jgi:hypothetical protein